MAGILLPLKLKKNDISNFVVTCISLQDTIIHVANNENSNKPYNAKNIHDMKELFDKVFFDSENKEDIREITIIIYNSTEEQIKQFDEWKFIEGDR